MNSQRGAQCAMWRGDEVGYAGAHERIFKRRGPAHNWPCQHCSGRAAHWGYNHEEPDPQQRMSAHAKPRPYSPNPDFYIPLCRSCHKRFDAVITEPAVA